jgi:hypothetical protein
MLDNKFPRVLLVNFEPIGWANATSVTMANLFRTWPRERIAQIFLAASEPDPAICPKSWRLGYEDLAFFSPVKNRLKKARQGRLEARAGGDRGLPLPEPQSRGAYRVLEDHLRTGLDLALEFFHFSLENSRLRALDDFRPQVIYSVLGTPRVINLASGLSKRYHIPLVPHIMDDWPTNFNRTKRIHHLFQAVTGIKVPALFRKAPFRFAIGPELSEVLGSRYGVHFEPLMNCVNPAQRPPYARRNDNGPVNFAYVGGLHSNRMAYLNDIGLALKRLGGEGIQGRLIIYRQNQEISERVHLEHGEVMRYATTQEEGFLETDQAKVDAFVHVDTFDPAYIDYFRHSLSAKLPWCMAGGVPFLAYGPPDNASMRYIKAQRVGLTVTERSSGLLENALTALIVDPALRLAMGKRARQEALDKHSDKNAQERLRQGLSYAAASCQSG